MKLTFKHTDTDFLKAFSIVFIINSHLDNIYPNHLFASGGSIGNSIFFLMSGYGLYLSYSNKLKIFTEWFSDRLMRVYPTLWINQFFIFIPFLIISGELNSFSTMPFLDSLILSPYWFINALILFYIFGYPILFFQKKKYIINYILLFGVIYTISYTFFLNTSSLVIESLPFKLLYYFIIFLLGALFGSIRESIIKFKINSIFIFIFSFLLYVLLKIFDITNYISSDFQFLQQLIEIPMVYSIFNINYSGFIQFLINKSRIKNFIKFLANITLELYLIHGFIISLVLKLQIHFIIKICLIFGLSFILAYGLKYLTNFLTLTVQIIFKKNKKFIK